MTVVCLQYSPETHSVAESFTRTGDGGWMCRFCCIILKSTLLSARKRHLQTVHLKERKYSCRHCYKRFGEAGNAKRHEKKCAVAQ